MREIVAWVLCSLSLSVYGQPSTGEGTILRLLAQAPDSVYRSTSSFSAFICSEFPGEKNIITAIYTWVGKSVTYDLQSVCKTGFDENPKELIERTFHTRRAVCQGYCALFNDLCRHCGVQSYVVHGYTKQEGEVKKNGHAWIVVKTGNSWYCMDPTWGAGYIQDGNFVRSFTFDYFMVNPESFIASHMPFDPMWQCMERPVSIEDFYYGEINDQGDNEPYAFADSIRIYEQLPVIRQYEITLHRIQQCGIRNDLIRDYALFISQILENDRAEKVYQYQSQVVERFNEAADHYNSAASLFNHYIHCYNRQFNPSLPDARIKQMIDTCDLQIKSAKRLIASVDPYDQKIRQNINHLKYAIRELENNIEKQKAFVAKYLVTQKGSRALLFRRQN